MRGFPSGRLKMIVEGGVPRPASILNPEVRFFIPASARRSRLAMAGPEENVLNKRVRLCFLTFRKKVTGRMIGNGFWVWAIKNRKIPSLAKRRERSNSLGLRRPDALSLCFACSTMMFARFLLPSLAIVIAAAFAAAASLSADRAPVEEAQIEGTALEDPPAVPPPGAEIPEGRPVSVYVIPVRDEVGQALLFVVRRGMKEAITLGADVVVLDMETPGGRLDVTLEIMEMLSRFEGRTLTYVNTEAISAGAFISAATNEIWFAPRGIIGAAAPVAGAGQEIPETMKLKIMSYLSARLESFTEGTPYRTEVLRAMMDATYELEIDGEVITGEGELLTLTATRAMKEYGDPPRPLLGEGIAKDLDDLFARKYGAENYTVTEFIPTWSEELARWLTAVSPLLLGIGLLCIFFEVKTPGFGVIGVAGLSMLALVFFGHHLAGLSGMEPLLLFLLGFLLVLVEVFFFPGLIVPAALGLLLMLGSLIWGMVDVWPGEGFTISPQMLYRPILNLMIGLCLALLGGMALAKFIPRSWFWDKMILEAGITGNTQEPEPALPGGSYAVRPDVGAIGVALTDLYPSGEVEIDGQRYQARLDHGSAERGETVEVVGTSNFGLLVRSKAR